MANGSEAKGSDAAVLPRRSCVSLGLVRINWGVVQVLTRYSQLDWTGRSRDGSEG